MSKAPLSESSCASSAALSRRQLLAGAGALTGSLLVGWRANDAKAGAHAGVSEAELTGWLRINPDNTVTVYCAMAEMGQGVMTSLGALAAEELEVDWSSVDVIMPDSHPRFRTARGRRITGNSASVMSNFKPLREAGAAARSMLQTAAAKQWQVPAAECVAAAGAISHAASGRTATYAQLAAAAAALPVPEKFELKQPADWTLIGQRLPRVDIEAKVSGAAVFGADVDLPGLQVATIMACPRFGGSLASVDPAPAMAIKGVTQVVSLDTAVAVVADGYWNAQLGLQALQPEWDMSTAVTDDAEAISAAGRQDIAHAGEFFWWLAEPERSDSARQKRLAELVASSERFVQATVQVSGRMELFMAGKRAEDFPDTRFCNPMINAMYAPDGNAKAAIEAMPHVADLIRDADVLAKQMTCALNEAGVTLVTGTDAPNAFLAEGFSLHEEIEAMVTHCGLTNAQALAVLTSNPAKVLGEADQGKVEEGAVADLVLLNADPMEDITATRAVHAVIANGALIDEANIEAGRKAILDAYAAMPVG